MNQILRVHLVAPILPAATHGVRFHFCITCLARGFQLQRALLVNLLTAWRFLIYVRFYLVLFKSKPENAMEHAALKKWCSDDLGMFMKEGCLVVGECAHEFFNSSICKNSAHQVAIDLIKSRPDHGHFRNLLVNLDADNVVYGEWLSALVGILTEATDVCSWKFNGEDGGCTGRIGVDMDTFVHTKGYCEELSFPSGSQDTQ